MNRLKIYLYLVFVLNMLNSKAQEFIDTVYFNENWKECKIDEASFYRIITNDKGKDFQFVVNDYYLNGQIQMSGIYKSINPDNKLGLFTYYYENGYKQIECNYTGNSLNGEYKEWYENGILKSIKHYNLGILEGETNYWDSHGVLTKKIEYKNGKKHGKFYTYYPSGILRRKDYYRNDSLIKGNCFDPEGNDTAYCAYIEPPTFVGGLSEFSKFILQELKYPQEAKKLNIEGQVYVKFSITKEGNVSKVSIIKEDKDYFNKEAIRVVQQSPHWIPGKKDGKPFEFSITFPIQFKLTH